MSEGPFSHNASHMYFYIVLLFICYNCNPCLLTGPVQVEDDAPVSGAGVCVHFHVQGPGVGAQGSRADTLQPGLRRPLRAARLRTQPAMLHRERWVTDGNDFIPVHAGY